MHYTLKGTLRLEEVGIDFMAKWQLLRGTSAHALVRFFSFSFSRFHSYYGDIEGSKRIKEAYSCQKDVFFNRTNGLCLQGPNISL